MDQPKRPLTDNDLIRATLSWHANEITESELRERVDSFLQRRSELGAYATSTADSGSIAGIVPVRTFTTLAEADAESKTFFYEAVPYEPLADVVDEPRGAWIPDGWGLYYAIDDYLYRISYGFVTILNITIMVGFLIVVAVALSAWQISTSVERQRQQLYKPMRSAEPGVKKPIIPLLNNSVPSSDSAASDRSPSSPEWTQESSNEAAHDTERQTPFDKALMLIDKPDLPAALTELELLEGSDQPDMLPLATLLKVESLMRLRNAESMELARQSLMDCKFAGQDLNFDLLVARWMMTCSASDRMRFIREAASLPTEARIRMVNWAKVRSGSASAILESEIESNAPRSPNGVCDRLFLASCQYNGGKSEQTLRELLDVQQKLRSLSTRGLDRVEAWLLESSKHELAEKVDDFVTLVSGKQVN